MLRPALTSLLLVAVLTACSGDDDADRAAEQPVPPEGMVYVGVDGVVAAVPETWGQGLDPLCGGTLPDTYWAAEPDPPNLECPLPGPGTEQQEFLEIVPAGSPGPGGYPCLSDRCPATWQLDGVTFLVGARHPSVVADDAPPTLRLPDGWTTVPFWPGETTRTANSESFAPVSEDDYRAILAEAGLEDVVTVDDADDRATTPDQGTVVRVP